MKSYSDTLKSNGPVITPEVAKKIAVTMADEEERACHVMLFLVKEKKGEDLKKDVKRVFSDLGEKPAI